VYFLTGELINLEDMLRFEIYRSCASDDVSLTPHLIDEMMEASRKLSVALVDKVIPEAHRFAVRGVNLQDKRRPELIAWFWNHAKILGIDSELKSAYEGMPDPPQPTWRALQSLCDRWVSYSTPSPPQRLQGYCDILRMLCVDPEEEELAIELHGDVIDIAAPRRVIAPVARVTDQLDIVADESWQWARSIDFGATSGLPGSDESQAKVDPASPGDILLLNLSSSEHINLSQGIEMLSETLGLAWTIRRARNDQRVYYPWPSAPAATPQDWWHRAKRWRLLLDEMTELPSIEGIVLRWIVLNCAEQLGVKVDGVDRMKFVPSRTSNVKSQIDAALGFATESIAHAQSAGIEEQGLRQILSRFAGFCATAHGLPTVFRDTLYEALQQAHESLGFSLASWPSRSVLDDVARLDAILVSVEHSGRSPYWRAFMPLWGIKWNPDDPDDPYIHAGV
jgi:hypothetical protein